MVTLNYPEIPKEKNLIVATGFFDGVHKGHQSILRMIVDKAAQQHTKSCLVTFWPHPRVVLGKDAENLRLLSTIEEKINLVSKIGIDYFYLIPFTQNFAQLSANEFFKNILVDRLNISQLYVGYNHHFGRGAQAGFDDIKCMGANYGVGVFKIDAVAEADGIKISSTNIRNALACGNVELAAELLGYEYFINGTVINGNHIGRTLGFPTANLQPSAYKMIPKNGVYAVRVKIENRIYGGMLNIGLRPTFNNTEKPVIEVNIFDFDENIYDVGIKVIFVKRIRDEVHFESVQKLVEQMQHDKNEIEAIIRK